MANVTRIIIGKDHFTNPACGFSFVDSVCVLKEPLDEDHIRIRRVNILYPGTVVETVPIVEEVKEKAPEGESDASEPTGEEASEATENTPEGDAGDAVEPEGETSDEPKSESDEDAPSGEPPVGDGPVAGAVEEEVEAAADAEPVEDEAASIDRDAVIAQRMNENNKVQLQNRVTELGGGFFSKTTKAELAAMIADAE